MGVTPTRRVLLYNYGIDPLELVQLAGTFNPGDELWRTRITRTFPCDLNYGFSGDGGPASQARLNTALGLGVGPDGSVYFVDRGNQRVRKVDASGIITTVARRSYAPSALTASTCT